MNTFMHIIPLKSLKNIKKEPVFTYKLTTVISYPRINIREEVSFQSLNVFNFIADEVKLHSWKVVRSDGEIITEGTSKESLELFYSDFESNVKEVK